MANWKGKNSMIIGICIMLAGIFLMGYRIGFILKHGIGAEAGYPMLGLFIFLAGMGVSLFGYSASKRQAK